MAARSEIELALQVSGASAVDGLSKSTANMRAQIGEAALAFGRGKIASDEFEATVRKLGTQLAREEKLLGQLRAAQEEAARSALQMAAAVDTAGDAVAVATDQSAAGVTKLGNASEELKKKTSQSAFALVELSRGLQDYSAAGMVGISNNVEGLARSFSTLATSGVSLTSVLMSPAGLVGGFTLLTTAAIVAGPKIQAAFSAIANGSNAVPAAAEKLDRLNDALEKSKERLEKLKGQQSLTNRELAEFNKLTERQVELQKQAKAEKERVDRAAKVDALQDPATAEAAKARAESLQADLGGKQGDVKAAMRVAAANNPKQNAEVAKAEAEVDAAYEEKFKTQREAPLNRFLNAKRDREVAAAEAKLKEAEAERDRKADDVVNRAFVDGDLGSFSKLQKAATERPAQFGPTAVAAIEKASPEAVKKKADAERAVKDGEARGERIRETAGVVAGASEKDASAVRAAILAQAALKKNTDREAAEFADMEGKAQKDLDAAAREGDRGRDRAAVAFQTKGAKEYRARRDDYVARAEASTTIDEEARVAAAQARAERPDGGPVRRVNPRTGALESVDPFVALSQDAALRARQADPGLTRDGAREVGVRVAGKAFSDVDDQNQENAQSLMARGMNATQATQQAALMTAQNTQALLQQVQQMEANLAALNRANGETNRGITGKIPTYLTRTGGAR